MGVNNGKEVSQKPESFFLKTLFSGFKKQGVKYAVMRNYQTLPYSSGGSDLDILIEKAYQDNAFDTLKDTIKNSHAIPLGVSHAPGFVKIFVLGKNPSGQGRWWGLRIDINIGLLYKGLPLIDEAQNLPYQRHNGINVLEKEFAGVLGVLKEVLNNGHVPDRYLCDAHLAVKSCWNSIERLLAPMGPKALSGLRQTIINEPANTFAACEKIRKDFYRYRLRTRPLGYLLGRGHSLTSRLIRYLKPSGKVIAILGTDGAGKSTIINAIKPALDEATHNATTIQHLRPNFLPPLARFKGGNSGSSGPVVNPHESRSSGLIGSLLRISYATLNYVLGYWFDTRLKIAKQPTIVIFDRYAYDILIDQKRFRIALPPALVRFFVRLAPKPDLIFCLVGSPEILAARKKELPLEEVTRQIEVLRAFAASEGRAQLISTEQSVEVCRDQILQAISSHCREGAGE